MIAATYFTGNPWWSENKYEHHPLLEVCIRRKTRHRPMHYVGQQTSVAPASGPKPIQI